MRDRAYQAGEGGEVPNCRDLAQLVSPRAPLRRPGGGTSLLYDSAPVLEWIATIGAQSGSSYLRRSNVWSADGAFKAAPDLRAHLYSVRDVAGGYALPRMFAIPPNKTGDKYERMWRRARLQVGGGRGRADMLATVDFEAAPIGAIRTVCPTARI